MSLSNYRGSEISNSSGAASMFNTSELLYYNIEESSTGLYSYSLFAGSPTMIVDDVNLLDISGV
jgi:hypothetical protein